MDPVVPQKKIDAPPHRWLGLRPVDFVRAAERRAAILTRQLNSRRSGAQRHYPLSPVPYPLSAP